jgi:anti-sigma B factor antagonist
MDEPLYSAEFDAERRVLAVTGDIDEVTGPQLREALHDHIDTGAPPVTVDLSEVTFLPSAAVSVLVTAMRAAEQSDTRLDAVATSGTISHRVLTICGVPVGEPTGSSAS